MEGISSKFWLMLGILAVALLANAVHPLVAALLGIAATAVFLWLILGGGK